MFRDGREPGLRDLELWSMESEGSGAREHGIWSFPESRSKKGMILSLERAIPFWFLGHFSFGFWGRTLFLWSRFSFAQTKKKVLSFLSARLTRLLSVFCILFTDIVNGICNL